MPLGSYNPIACMVCNREVAPETVAFSPELAEQIADWHADYSALDHLWLRGPREMRAWARLHLANIQSSVNQRGLELRQRLEHYRPCYYWVFGWREGLAELRHCPVCHQRLLAYDGYRIEWWVCETCGIVADSSTPAR
jgi:predicted  nucleic acid-binding Zn ribbon protein